MIIFHIGLSTNIWLQTPFFDSNQACLQSTMWIGGCLPGLVGHPIHGSSGLVGPTPTIWFVHFVDLLCISFGKKQITPIVVTPKILAQLSSKDGRRQIRNLTIHFSKTLMIKAHGHDYRMKRIFSTDSLTQRRRAYEMKWTVRIIWGGPWAFWRLYLEQTVFKWNCFTHT